MLGGGWTIPITRFTYAVVGNDRGVPTRTVISCLRIGLASALLVVLAACDDLPCQPAIYYAPEAGAPYQAVEARVRAPAGHTLVGTLTLPNRTAAPVPAVVLISGSNAQTRDMVGSNAKPIALYRPFRQIADSLSRRGIAVLRLDDRGIGCSSGGPLSEATTAARADDTRAALEFLRGRKEIDPYRLGLVGMSEGADIAIMIAATDHALRGVVSMAGSASRGWEIWAYQTRYKISLGEEMSRSQMARWQAGENPERILEERVAEARAHVRAGKADPWWTFFFDYDPLTAAREVTSPVLILHGDRDSNVPVAHANKLARVIRDGGNPNVTVKIYPGHNHLFLPDEHGGFRRYEEVLARTNKVPEYVLIDIGDWLVRRLGNETPKN